MSFSIREIIQPGIFHTQTIFRFIAFWLRDKKISNSFNLTEKIFESF
jgi:hypothetical protein